ncbi:MAG: glycosyltransferase family 2 protein [Acidobacteriia bacterium]|nr:glycosyltransferase family 2 protein [Terriglobia bacterium]
MLSVVLPAYNEEKNIRAMYGAVRSALSEEAIEFVFVDDGSSDGTADAVRGLREEGAPVRLVRFGRNFGHQAALFAGLERAHGSAIIMMDCDLQHPPDLLPCMTRAWRGGAKVVQMVRLKTEDAHLFKRVSSRLFYAVLNFLSEVPVQAAAADFQLLDRQVVDAVLQFKDRKPFVRGLISWLGFPVTRIEYTASARHAGVSGYSLRKMLRLSVQAITGLSSKPLQISFYMGLLSSAFCLAYALFAVIGYFKGLTIPGWTSVIIVVTFLGAVQLLSVGILGEYIARIYEQSRAVPRCVVVEADESIPECSSSFAAPYAPEFGNFAD